MKQFIISTISQENADLSVSTTVSAVNKRKAVQKFIREHGDVPIDGGCANVHEDECSRRERNAANHLYSIRITSANGTRTILDNIRDRYFAEYAANQLARYAQLGIITEENGMDVTKVSIYQNGVCIGVGENQAPDVNTMATAFEICRTEDDDIDRCAIIAYDNNDDMYYCLLDGIDNMQNAIQLAKDLWEAGLWFSICHDISWLEVWGGNPKTKYFVFQKENDPKGLSTVEAEGRFDEYGGIL